MKIIYLASYHADLGIPDVVYQDKFVERDIMGDMLDVDLNAYDIIIATPPCNYWSKARGNLLKSDYALNTRKLLPGIIWKLMYQDKPYIVENVINKRSMRKILRYFNGHYYEIGRHSYFTNVPFNVLVSQTQQFNYGGSYVGLPGERQGGSNVNNVLKLWLDYAFLEVRSYA